MSSASGGETTKRTPLKLHKETNVISPRNQQGLKNDQIIKYFLWLLGRKEPPRSKERFEKQTEALNQEVAINVEQLQEQRREVTDRRQICQSLELELQTHLNMKKPLEDTLAETEARYSFQLAQIRETIAKLEAQLRQLRADMEAQNTEYSVLLDIKTRLELEIATYRRLLEGEDVGLVQEDAVTTELEKRIK